MYGGGGGGGGGCGSWGRSDGYQNAAAAVAVVVVVEASHWPDSSLPLTTVPCHERGSADSHPRGGWGLPPVADAGAGRPISSRGA